MGGRLSFKCLAAALWAGQLVVLLMMSGDVAQALDLAITISRWKREAGCGSCWSNSVKPDGDKELGHLVLPQMHVIRPPNIITSPCVPEKSGDNPKVWVCRGLQDGERCENKLVNFGPKDGWRYYTSNWKFKLMRSTMRFKICLEGGLQVERLGSSFSKRFLVYKPTGNDSEGGEDSFIMKKVPSKTNSLISLNISTMGRFVNPFAITTRNMKLYGRSKKPKVVQVERAAFVAAKDVDVDEDTAAMTYLGHSPFEIPMVVRPANPNTQSPQKNINENRLAPVIRMEKDPAVAPELPQSDVGWVAVEVSLLSIPDGRYWLTFTRTDKSHLEAECLHGALTEETRKKSSFVVGGLECDPNDATKIKVGDDDSQWMHLWDPLAIPSLKEIIARDLKQKYQTSGDAKWTSYYRSIEAQVREMLADVIPAKKNVVSKNK